MKIVYLTLLASLLLLIQQSCNSNIPVDASNNTTPSIAPNTIDIPKEITLNIIGVYPHDADAYTQGLELFNGKMYEGTGDFAKSSVRLTDYKTGNVVFTHIMGSDKIFGEGITIYNNKLYQLTWQSSIVNVYNINNLDKPEKTFTWPFEGWGITHYKNELIVSDGTSSLFFVNPDDFKILRSIKVMDNNGPVDYINELEMIDGFLYANRYMQDYILKIDLATGNVVGKISLAGLIQKHAPTYQPQEGEVLNGIAYDSTTKKVFITGKRWPKMFEAVFN
jgi:glutaminyl-peptide cyclotransferase